MTDKVWPCPAVSLEIQVFSNKRVAMFTSRRDYDQAEAFLGAGTETPLSVCGKSDTYFHATGDTLYLIGVFDGSQQTLVHECVHSAIHILKDCKALDTSDAGGEVLSYLTDYLFGALVRGLPE